MDIPKYVGLFLLKNEYCFLPGIGSLQIQKSPAVYNKETQQMSAPTYNVKFIKGVGSIDDSFANFIANNERISIAHASNHLKDFCAGAKIDLKEGREVPIPGIGKFVGGANDAVQFVTDADLHIEGKSIPFFKNAAAAQEQQAETLSNIIERTTFKEPKADEEIEYQAPKVNWGKIALLIGIVLAVIAGGIYLFMALTGTKKEGEKSEDTQETIAVEQTTDPVVTDTATQTTAADTSATSTNAISTTSNADGTLTYKVLLQTYNNRAKAETRVAKLKSYGNGTVEMVVKDTANFYVVMNMSTPAVDTTRVVDSLRRLFNPSGNVVILR